MKNKLFINSQFETIINRAVFLNEELIVYPQREKYSRDLYYNLTNVVKFLFGEGAYVVEDCTNGYPSFTIKGASFELRNAHTINADWTYQEVKQ